MNNTQTSIDINDIEAFYQEILTNPSLQEELRAATTPESLCELAVELAAKHGYCVSIEQLQAALSIETAIGALSPEQLLDTTSSLQIHARSRGGGGNKGSKAGGGDDD